MKGVSKATTVIVVSALVLASLSVFAYFYLHGTSGTGLKQPGSGTRTGSNYSGTIIGNFEAPNVLAASDVVVNYTFTVTSIGSVPPYAEIIVASPQGISLNMEPSNVTITPGQTSVINAEVSVSNSVTPGTYNVVVSFANGRFIQNESLSIQVVKYLVVTVDESFLPKNITVPVGSTVVWYRLNGVLSQYDSGVHNVVFTNGMASSPPLQQYQSWSYTFDKAGVYNYECTYHLPFMVGVVTVK